MFYPLHLLYSLIVINCVDQKKIVIGSYRQKRIKNTNDCQIFRLMKINEVFTKL